ncbi:uncharacterized protein LOC127239230 isoform X1 [Andrographis paniculata]|uniref:uncharacterized protein LOC127239230 isoform X1 n=1 Tax=Andrographis paniculata TaxID=175694 RepID=UPI0021E835A0|nr:uncharacterized protein LOC127239230 isoform X1 [Andrographis paniculata]
MNYSINQASGDGGIAEEKNSSPVSSQSVYIYIYIYLHTSSKFIGCKSKKRKAMAIVIAFASKLCYCFLLLLFSLLAVSSSFQEPAPPSPPSPSVYEILPLYGLPRGLLPDSVVSYTLADDGRFEVTLEKECYIEFDYLVYYDKKISGVLNLGSITDLKGIQVQRFYFLWFNVDEIKVDLPPSDSIYFKVGIISKELDVDQFLTVRSCRDKAVSLRQPVLEMPVPVDGIPMLVTD